MSANPNVVILYSISDSDIEGSMSSTARSPPPIPLVPVLPLSASGEETEPFEDEETAPTPHVAPIAPPEITCTPTDTSSPATTSPPEPMLMFRREKTIQVASKRVRYATSTYRNLPSPTVPTPPPAIPATTCISTSLLPPRKRARFTTPDSPTTTESESAEPPPVYHVGECSRAAAAREPTVARESTVASEPTDTRELADVTLEGQLGAHQDQIDSLDYRVDVDIKVK
jgi:hypothetical protein